MLSSIFDTTRLWRTLVSKGNNVSEIKSDGAPVNCQCSFQMWYRSLHSTLRNREQNIELDPYALKSTGWAKRKYFIPQYCTCVYAWCSEKQGYLANIPTVAVTLWPTRRLSVAVLLYSSLFHHIGRNRIKTRNSSGDEIANVNFLYDDIVHALKMQ